MGAPCARLALLVPISRQAATVSAAADAAAADGPSAAGPAPCRASATSTADAGSKADAAAAAWARLVERRVAELLLPPGAPPPPPPPADSGYGRLPDAAVAASPNSGGLPRVSARLLGGARPSEPEPGWAAAARLDRVALLHYALFLSAGRVRALAAALAAPSPAAAAASGGGLYRRTPDARLGGLPWQLLVPPPPSRDDDDDDAAHGPSAGLSGASSTSEAYLTSTFFRFSVLQLAVASCAAAANRLAHVPSCHEPGRGADLRALCIAHSNAAALGAATELLLVVSQVGGFAGAERSACLCAEPCGGVRTQV
jgi:hypothetical protein